MSEQRPLVWLGLLALVAIVFLGFSYMWPSNVGEGGHKQSRKESRAVQANIAKEQQIVEAKTKDGAAELQAADKTHAVVTTARAKAISAHIKSRSHATPTPTVVADTTIARLQSRLSNYGN